MNEKKRLLIAYDGSASAKEALNDLHRAALPAKCEALVVSVCDAVLPPDTLPAIDVRNGPQARAIAREIETMVEAARSRALEAVSDADQLVEEGIQFLRANFPAWEVHGQSMVGDTSSAVLKEALQWNIELIVVGTHGRSAVGRLLLGSVSYEVAVAAMCSVRIARSTVGRRDLPIRILIRLDGSAESEIVVNQLALRTWPAGSEAVIVAHDENRNREEQKVRERIAVVEEDLRAVAGLHVSSKIAEVDSEKVLIAEARRIGADCIFVGSTMNDRNDGHPGIVSAPLLIGAPCSVEVVRQR